MAFDQNDWNHLHDVVLDTTGKDCGQHELEQLFATLPDELQQAAHNWGMSDTTWRDAVHTYFSELTAE